jgi:hypothetical protein
MLGNPAIHLLARRPKICKAFAMRQCLGMEKRMYSHIHGQSSTCLGKDTNVRASDTSILWAMYTYGLSPSCSRPSQYTFNFMQSLGCSIPFVTPTSMTQLSVQWASGFELTRRRIQFNNNYSRISVSQHGFRGGLRGIITWTRPTVALRIDQAALNVHYFVKVSAAFHY